MGRTLPRDRAAGTLRCVILAALHRVLWFAIAVTIGLLWAYSEQVTSRPLSVHAHLVLGTLFAAALTTAGYNLRELLAWRRELQQLAERADMTPADLADARRLLLVLRERDPRRIGAIRAAIRDTNDGRDP